MPSIPDMRNGISTEMTPHPQHKNEGPQDNDSYEYTQKQIGGFKPTSVICFWTIYNFFPVSEKQDKKDKNKQQVENGKSIQARAEKVSFREWPRN